MKNKQKENNKIINVIKQTLLLRVAIVGKRIQRRKVMQHVYIYISLVYGLLSLNCLLAANNQERSSSRLSPELVLGEHIEGRQNVADREEDRVKQDQLEKDRIQQDVEEQQLEKKRVEKQRIQRELEDEKVKRRRIENQIQERKRLDSQRRNE